jgi:hypothetical protein
MHTTGAEVGADIFACLATCNIHIATASWRARPPIDPETEKTLSKQKLKRKIYRRKRHQKEFFLRKIKSMGLTSSANDGTEPQRGHHLLLCVFQALAQRLKVRVRDWYPLSVTAPIPTREEVDKVVIRLAKLHRHIVFDAEASAVHGAGAVQGAGAAEDNASLQAARRDLAIRMAGRPASMQVRLAKVPFTPTAAAELADVDEADVTDDMSAVSSAPTPAPALAPSSLRLHINGTASHLAVGGAEAASDGADVAETSAVASAPVPLTPVLTAAPDTPFDGACGAEANEPDFLWSDTSGDKDDDGVSESEAACGLEEARSGPAQEDDRQERIASDKAPTMSAGQPTTTAGAGELIEWICLSDDDDDDDDENEGKKDADSSSEDEEDQPLKLVCQPRPTVSSNQRGYVSKPDANTSSLPGQGGGAAAAVALQPGTAGAAPATLSTRSTSTPPLYTTVEPALQATPGTGTGGPRGQCAVYQTPSPLKEAMPYHSLAQTLLHRDKKRSLSHRSRAEHTAKRAKHQIWVAARQEHV